MLCPVCGADQAILEFQGVELDLCLQGHGIWFDRDELTQLFTRAGAPQRQLELEQHLAAQQPRRRGRRRCPRCRTRMERVSWGRDGAEVVLVQCRHRHGLWFDRGELEQVLAAELGAAMGPVQDFLRRYHDLGRKVA